MTIATEMRDKYLAAETAILAGQQVRFNDRWLTRADLEQVQAGRREWERRVDAETRTAAGSGSIRYQTPDFS